MENTLYLIGLIVAASYILFSIDDLFWDIFSIRAKVKSVVSEQLPMDKLDAIPPKLIAVMVAAWHEDNVLEPVIDNMIASVQYPGSMFHVFLGVYPNDPDTIEVAERLEHKYQNVHMVVNARPGPTNKADNINNIIRNIKAFELKHNWRFASVTVHDSEDVIHPYELKITSFLLDRYAALQFPVIPLQKMPTLKNIFQGMTTGTYADEFAENHFRTMAAREAMSALVPSAGTGFVLSRRILDYFGDEPVFPEDSLTEDYKLSLILAQNGFKVHYVLEKIPRLLDNDSVKWDYVATRSFFPDTFSAAVRQKTRWIYGITMQSIKISDIFKNSRLGFAGRYSLYKDLKAKAGNIMFIPGYLVFLYFILSFCLPIPDMFPINTLSWQLCVFLTFLMVFRQTMRAVAITNFYGFKSMIVACLLPPLMPIRLVWGNIINLSATLRAWKLYFAGTSRKKSKKSKKVAWSKTDHTFLNAHILYRYYRKVGDVLLEKQYIDVSTLASALRSSRLDGLLVGEVLLRQGLVTEEHLMSALANIQHKVFVVNINIFAGNFADEFDKDTLKRLLVYPLLKAKDSYVFAGTDHTPSQEIASQLGIDPNKLHYVFTTRSLIYKLIERTQPPEPSYEYRFINELFENGDISWEQAVLALNYAEFTQNILKYMGLSDKIRDLESPIMAAHVMEANV